MMALFRNRVLTAVIVSTALATAPMARLRGAKTRSALGHGLQLGRVKLVASTSPTCWRALLRRLIAVAELLVGLAEGA